MHHAQLRHDLPAGLRLRRRRAAVYRSAAHGAVTNRLLGAAAALAAGLAVLLAAAAPAAAQPLPVTGRVVDERGEPLAGARVELLPELPPFDRQVLQLAGEDDPDAAATATTGTDGRYELAAPEAGFWTVRASAADRFPEHRFLRPLLAAHELAPLSPPPARGLTVRVLDARGEPVPGAAVASMPLPWLGREADGPAWMLDRVTWVRTGADGRAVVPRWEGAATHVEALAPGHALAAGRTDGATLDLRLEPGAERAVRVLESDGSAAAGAVVALGRLGLPAARTGEDGGARVRVAGSTPVLVHARSAAGDWVANPLAPPAPPPAPGGAPPAAHAAASARPPVLDLRFPPARRVEVRVTDAETGRAVPGAVVWTAAPHEIRATPAAGGTFALRLPEVAGGAEGYGALVRAAARGYVHGAAEAALPHGGTDSAATAVTVELRPERRQRGRVVDEAGQPVAGADLGAWPVGYQAEEPLVAARSAADGSFTLSGLAAEVRYTLVADRRGLAEARTLIAVPPEGEAPPVELVLRPGIAAVGRVLDAEGVPVPGATVTLTPAPEGREPNAALVAFDATGPRGQHAGTAGAEGRFRLPDVAAGRYDLEARAPGFAPLRVPGVEVAPPPGPAGEPADLGTLHLDRGAELHGRVVDAGGEPLAEVRVELMDTRTLGDRAEAVTGDDGRFTLSGLPSTGWLMLLIDREGYQSVQRQLALPVREPLEVTLQRTAGVAGVVIGPDGEPFEGAQLSIEVEREDGMGSGGTQRVGADGRFARDLEPGTVRVAAFAEGMSSGAPVELVLGPGERRDDLRLVLSSGGTVEGRVTGRGGRPVTGAWIAYGSPRGQTITDLEGHYRLGGLPPGRHTLRITHRDYPAAQREIEMGTANQTLDIRLDAGGEIHVRAVDEAGEPLAGVQVGLGQGLGVSRGGDSVTAADGRHLLRGLEPGRYWVQLTRPGHATVRSDEVEVAAGETVELELQMVRGATVTGRLLGLEAAELGTLEIAMSGPEFLRTGPGTVSHDGTYRVEGVTPGQWTLRVSRPPGWASRQVPVTVGEAASQVVADVDFGTAHALAGTVRRGGAAWTEAQVNVSCPGAHGWARTDGQGRFLVRGLPAGRCRVRVDGAGGPGAVRAEQAVDLAGDREIAIDVPTPPPAGSVPP